MLKQHENEITDKNEVISRLNKENNDKDLKLQLQKGRVESLTAQKAALEAELEAITAQLRAPGLSPPPFGEGRTLARSGEDRAASAAGTGLFRRPSRLIAEAAASALAGVAAPAAVAHSS